MIYMNEQLKRSLSIWGADIDGAVRRFAGNEALYKSSCTNFYRTKPTKAFQRP